MKGQIIYNAIGKVALVAVPYGLLFAKIFRLFGRLLRRWRLGLVLFFLSVPAMFFFAGLSITPTASAHSLTQADVNLTFNAPLASTGTQSESGTFTATYAPDGRINASRAYVATISESATCPNSVTSVYDQLPNVANTEASGEIIVPNPGRICLLIAYINNNDLHGPFVLVYSQTPANTASDDYTAGRARCFTGDTALNGGPWVASEASGWRNQARCGFEGGTWRLRPSNLDDPTGDDEGLSYVCSNEAYLNQNRCVWEGGTWSIRQGVSASDCDAGGLSWNPFSGFGVVDVLKCIFNLFTGVSNLAATGDVADDYCTNMALWQIPLRFARCMVIPDTDTLREVLGSLVEVISGQFGVLGEPVRYLKDWIDLSSSDVSVCGVDTFTRTTDSRLLGVGGGVSVQSRPGQCIYSFSFHSANSGNTSFDGVVEGPHSVDLYALNNRFSASQRDTFQKFAAAITTFLVIWVFFRRSL